MIVNRWKVTGFPVESTNIKQGMSASSHLGVDPRRAVLVKCAPTLEEDILSLFLKNKHRSGGGPLKSLSRISETSFLVEFEKLEGEYIIVYSVRSLVLYNVKNATKKTRF